MSAGTIPMDNNQQDSWSPKVYVATIGIGGGHKAEGPGQTLRDEQATEAERTYTTFQHLVGLSSLIEGMGFLGLIGSIIMWRIKADESPFYDDHGREAVNFQISLLVYLFTVGLILGLFTLITLGAGAILAAPLMALFTFCLLVVRLVGCIRGSIAANKGEYYRYPMTLRFLV